MMIIKIFIKKHLTDKMYIFIIFFLVYETSSGDCTSTVDYTLNLASNGDFQDPVIPAGQDYIEGPNVKIAGWDSDIMQLGRGVKFNTLWGNTQVIQMDTTKNQNYTKVQTLAAGKYLLSFQHAAREKRGVETSGLGIYWNGVMIFDFIATDKLVHTQTIIVEAVEGPNTIIFEGRGASDKYGMSIDNVAFYEMNDYNREPNCECQYGYFEDGQNYTCIDCEVISPGCEDCEYNYQNVSGSSFSSHQFSCTACLSGQYSDGSFCLPCSHSIDNCLQCTIDGLDCQECDNTMFIYDLRNDTFGLIQVLNTTFRDNICVECPIDNCVTCLTAYVCVLCNNSNNYYLNLSTSWCDQCTLEGCVDCATLTTCSTCNTSALYVLESSLCQYCNDTEDYFINALLVCEHCMIYQPQCIDCLNMFECILCNATNQYFVNRTNNLCQPCTLEGCLNCSSLVVCQECDTLNGYGFDYTNLSICGKCNVSCSCDGYYPPWTGSQCTPLCGDNYITIDQQCDDGNENDDDGCSSLCKIQEHFNCQGQPSSCIFVTQIQIQMIDIKPIGCNSLQITISLTPNIQLLYSEQVKDSIQMNASYISITKYTIQAKSLIIQAQYGQDIWDGDIIIQFHPSRYLFQTTSNSTYLQANAYEFHSIIPLLYYDQQECSIKESVKTFMKAVQIISYVILGLSLLFSCKIVGLQLFGVLQLVYYDLAFYDYLTIYFEPLLSLKSVSGYNIPLQQQSTQLPEIVQNMDVQSLFVNNFNIMYFVLLGQMCLAGIIYLVGKVLAVKKLKKVGKYLLKQGLITIIFFNCFNAAFSAGIYWKYAEQDSILNEVLLYLIIVIMVAVLIALQLTNKQEYGQFKSKFKRDCVSKLYITVSILYRIALGAYIALESDFEEGTSIILAFSLLFMLYNLVNLPYSSPLHNYRANIIHITQFIILMVASYYRSMKSTTPMNQKGKIYTPAIIVLVCIGICMLVSLVMLVYEGVVFFKGLCNKLGSKVNDSNQVINQTQQNVNQLQHGGFK